MVDLAFQQVGGLQMGLLLSREGVEQLSDIRCCGFWVTRRRDIEVKLREFRQRIKDVVKHSCGLESHSVEVFLVANFETIQTLQ